MQCRVEGVATGRCTASTSIEGCRSVHSRGPAMCFKWSGPFAHHGPCRPGFVRLGLRSLSPVPHSALQFHINGSIHHRTTALSWMLEAAFFRRLISSTYKRDDISSFKARDLGTNIEELIARGSPTARCSWVLVLENAFSGLNTPLSSGSSFALRVTITAASVVDRSQPLY